MKKLIVVLTIFFSFRAQAQTYYINTIAGNGTAGYSGDGGAATSAELGYPYSAVVDTAGNLYIGDYNNNRVRKVSPGGIISTIAGNGIRGFSGDGSAATSAEFYYVNDVIIDGSGNLYIADQDNDRIRKVTPGGIISTIAGGGNSGLGDGGPATLAELSAPNSLAVDGQGNIYITDNGNQRIRKVTISTGIISTIAGNGTYGYNGDNITATAAELSSPSQIAIDGLGNVYIADFNSNRIRKVTVSTGIISTIAGNGSNIYSGDGGLATSAGLTSPGGVAVDRAGNIYIADQGNNRIRKINASTGIISTIAGNGVQGFAGDGGIANSAELYNPTKVAVDGSGNVYIADISNQRIRKLCPATSPGSISGSASVNQGTSQTYSIAAVSGATSYIWTLPSGWTGSSTSTSITTTVGSTGGTISVAAVNACGYASPQNTLAVTVNTQTSSQTIYIINYVAGDAQSGYFPGNQGIATDFGSIGTYDTISASLNNPIGIAVDAEGNVYVADAGNNLIRKVTLSERGLIKNPFAYTYGYINNIAGTTDPLDYPSLQISNAVGVALDGSGNIYYTNGEGITKAGVFIGYATSSNPTSIAVDAAGQNVYFSEPDFNEGSVFVKKIDVNTGVISIIGEVKGATTVNGLAVDANGNVYITDAGNHRILKLTPSGSGSGIVAGTGTAGYSGDGGLATLAELNAPTGVAIDKWGNIYIADGYIRKITPSGIISTIAGTSAPSGSKLGGLATTVAINAEGIAVDDLGNVYFTSGSDVFILYPQVSSQIWVGPTGGDWNTAANWSKGTVPLATDTIVIPPGASAIISGTVNIGYLTLSLGASLTVNGTLNISHDLTNDVGTISGSGIIVFNGSSAQTIFAPAAISCNITIDNPSGVSINFPAEDPSEVAFDLSQVVSLSAYINLTSGTLTTNDALNIDLDKGGIAYHSGDAGNISGTVVFTKSASKAYHIISMPTNDIIQTNLLKDSIYFYNETDHSKTDTSGYYQGWQKVAANNLPATEGFATYFTAATVMNLTGNYNHSWADTTVTLNYTPTNPTPDALHDGWSLLGNPYPSSLDWDGLTSSLTNKAIYYYDASQSKYISYIAGVPANGNIIPSAQGFWVQASAAGEQITFSNQARVTTAPNSSYYRAAAVSNLLQLSLSNGSNSDTAYFRFNDNATLNFDGSLDARKWMNGGSTPSLYSQLGITQYSINSIPYPTTGTKIPLKIKAAFAGQYTFNADNISNLDASINVYLNDQQLNIIQDLRVTPTYTYTASPTDTAQRFSIVFCQAAATGVQTSSVLSSTGIDIKGIANQVEIDFLNPDITAANVSVYTIVGEQQYVASSVSASSGIYTFNPGQKQEGIYIVKVVTAQGSYTGKVYLKTN